MKEITLNEQMMGKANDAKESPTMEEYVDSVQKEMVKILISEHEEKINKLFSVTEQLLNRISSLEERLSKVDYITNNDNEMGE